jgi:hypothetical protein
MASDASAPFPKLGKEQTDAMLGVHKELLEACEQANRAGLARVKSEVDRACDRWKTVKRS